MMLVTKSTSFLFFAILSNLGPKAAVALNGCCSLNYKTCINWCGKTEKSCTKCNHHDGVAWLKDGAQEKCKKRWKGCANNPKACCDGLVCRKDKNDYKMCLPPKKGSTLKPTEPPTTPPTASPTDFSTKTPTVYPTFLPTQLPYFLQNSDVSLKSVSDTGDKGCCTLDFINCIDWCGPTKDSCLNCNHHDGVFWMKNGPPNDQCISRWTGCQRNRNACCDGLICQPDANNYLMCLPSFLAQTDSPTPSPSAQPSGSPSMEPSNLPSLSPSSQPSDAPSSVPSSFPSDLPSELPSESPSVLSSSSPSSVPSASPSSPPSSSFSSSPTATPSVSPSSSPTSQPTLFPTKAPKSCCTLDFKNCIDWCGPSYNSCSSCNHHDGLGWLKNGPPEDDECLGRWTGCGNNVNGCCDGLVCKEDENNYLMCLPKNLIGLKTPSGSRKLRGGSKLNDVLQ